MRVLELYIHFPFCVRKCLYCDFLSIVGDDETRERYIRALCREIEQEADKYWGRVVTSVFVGGGTPSLMTDEQLRRVMDVISGVFCLAEDAEITMEANPGTIRASFVQEMKTAGINRVSLGLQAVDATQLQCLGRIHTYETFLESYQMLRNAGIDNINIDLMMALPGQTKESWVNTIENVIALDPAHISAYSLIIEEGTPFYSMYGRDEEPKNQPPLPDEDTERLMYEMTRTILEAAGYNRYEISNYSKPGKECRHNIGYWKRTDYLGLGLGAASLIDNRRFKNTIDMNRYLTLGSQHFEVVSDEKRYDEIFELSQKEQMEEFMFLGLRLIEGISGQDFFNTFHTKIESIYNDILNNHINQGLIKKEKGRITLTPKGIDISNYVLSDYLLANE